MVKRVDRRMASLKELSVRSAIRCLALIALLAASAVPAATQETNASKKVGTERIVVTPPTAAKPDAAPTPEEAAERAPRPAPPPAVAPSIPSSSPPEVHKGETDLPPAVAKMRKRLLDAAYAGDMQKLKIAIQSNEMPPVFSVNEVSDPIDYLKAQSGDGQGMEILAILTDVLESSWARVSPGTPQEMYVWPAYAALPIDKLEPPQLVELYKIVTSADFEEMKSVGRYTFYSVGIGPDGTWHWFRPAD